MSIKVSTYTRKGEMLVLGYDPDFLPCPRCGAWKWEEDRILMQQDRLRCGECAYEARCQDLEYVLVGQD